MHFGLYRYVDYANVPRILKIDETFEDFGKTSFTSSFRNY